MQIMGNGVFQHGRGVLFNIHKGAMVFLVCWVLYGAEWVIQLSHLFFHISFKGRSRCGSTLASRWPLFGKETDLLARWVMLKNCDVSPTTDIGCDALGTTYRAECESLPESEKRGRFAGHMDRFFFFPASRCSTQADGCMYHPVCKGRAQRRTPMTGLACCARGCTRPIHRESGGATAVLHYRSLPREHRSAAAADRYVIRRASLKGGWLHLLRSAYFPRISYQSPHPPPGRARSSTPPPPTRHKLD
jgi:hypothetical protein